MIICADTMRKNTVSCCTQLEKQRRLLSTRLTTGEKKQYIYNGVGDRPILYAYITQQGCPTSRYESTATYNRVIIFYKYFTKCTNQSEILQPVLSPRMLPGMSNKLILYQNPVFRNLILDNRHHNLLFSLTARLTQREPSLTNLLV